jgi:hypothetical protein
MQSQAPVPPYVWLWTRLERFRPDRLSRLLPKRRAVPIVPTRATVHLVISCSFVRVPVVFRAKSLPQIVGGICRTKAHYPYCSYNDRWSCPFPPPENRLKVKIEAGEKSITSKLDLPSLIE